MIETRASYIPLQRQQAFRIPLQLSMLLYYCHSICTWPISPPLWHALLTVMKPLRVQVAHSLTEDLFCPKRRYIHNLQWPASLNFSVCFVQKILPLLTGREWFSHDLPVNRKLLLPSQAQDLAYKAALLAQSDLPSRDDL